MKFFNCREIRRKASAVVVLILIITQSQLLFAQGDLALGEIAKDYLQYANDDFGHDWTHSRIIASYYFEGSDIPEAYVHLYSNGVLVLESKFYSADFKETENYFFEYVVEGDSIRISSIDKRFDVEDWLRVESFYATHRPIDVLSVDEEAQTVEYLYDDMLLFLGVYFYRVATTNS